MGLAVVGDFCLDVGAAGATGDMSAVGDGAFIIDLQSFDFVFLGFHFLHRLSVGLGLTNLHRFSQLFLLVERLPMHRVLSRVDLSLVLFGFDILSPIALPRNQGLLSDFFFCSLHDALSELILLNHFRLYVMCFNFPNLPLLHSG